MTRGLRSAHRLLAPLALLTAAALVLVGVAVAPTSGGTDPRPAREGSR